MVEHLPSMVNAPPTVMRSSAASSMKTAESFSVSIHPPVMEDFFVPCKIQRYAAPLHISVIRRPQYLIYTNYLLPLLSHRKSSTPPQMGGFYSAKKKKGERRLFRLRLVKRYSLLRFMILLIILWLNEYRMRNRILLTMPHFDIAI